MKKIGTRMDWMNGMRMESGIVTWPGMGRPPENQAVIRVNPILLTHPRAPFFGMADAFGHSITLPAKRARIAPRHRSGSPRHSWIPSGINFNPVRWRSS
jgi:hypothetical protein